MKRTQKETAQVPAISISLPKRKVVSFRLSEEQHALLVARCNNSYGESLMTLSEYARYTVLYQRVAHPSDVPLERYRLAIAAQMAVAMTDMVQYLDQVAPASTEKHIHGFEHVCEELAKLQRNFLILLGTDNLK